MKTLAFKTLLAYAATFAAAPAAAEDQVQLAMVNYRACLTMKAVAFGRGQDPAGDVVNRAFAACRDFRLELGKALVASVSGATATAMETSLKWTDDQEHPRLLSLVLERRTAK